MSREIRFRISETDSIFECLAESQNEHPDYSYRECFNALCDELEMYRSYFKEPEHLAELTVQKLKEEYDPIWRVRSYATGKNVEILIETMNSLLLQLDVEAVMTNKKKATALSYAETAVNDRLRKFRTHALTQKGKRE